VVKTEKKWKHIKQFDRGDEPKIDNGRDQGKTPDCDKKDAQETLGMGTETQGGQDLKGIERNKHQKKTKKKTE